MSGPCDTDVVEWSEQQARLLARHAASCKPQGDFAEAPDWANIIEEIESVGRSEVSAVEAWWFQAFLRDLKAEARPLSRDAPHWRGEARGFRAQARRKYRPSMQSKIDLAGLYADALPALPDTMDDAKSEGFARGQPPFPLPPACPVTPDELLG